ncbi:MAG TPA: hypothetical protein VGA61_04520 [Anaerolineae bacterium]
MSQPLSACPHLVLAGEQMQPDEGNRCHAQVPPALPDRDHQLRYCLGEYKACLLYMRAAHAAEEETRRRGRPRWRVIIPSLAVLAVLAVLGVIYGRGLLPAPTPAPRLTAPGASITATPVPPNTSTAVPTPTTTVTAYATPTPEPAGRGITLTPRADDAGWWVSGDERGNHLGDSFLYSGYFEAKAYVAVVRFDLRTVPRGAPIRDVTVRLTGLQADRLRPDPAATWSVQLLPADPAQDLARASFQTLFTAPGALNLFPVLRVSDLGVRKVNQWSLQPAERDWLARQLLAGAAGVYLRITGPAAGDGTLFAWDSGAGQASLGEGPQLVLSLGAGPAVPPPLPTMPLVVATASPTPANVLTAAAYAAAATRTATAVGTGTPVAGNFATPTPPAANLATAQAMRVPLNLPPLVVFTPTPANGATATANAAYATAVAVTTGTFTPVPTDAVTPVVILPTDIPENVMTAAVQFLTATAREHTTGTPTPAPLGAVIATVTPGLVVTPTPVPANIATSSALRAYATAVAVTTGTFTPMPPWVIVATPTPPAP